MIDIICLRDTGKHVEPHESLNPQSTILSLCQETKERNRSLNHTKHGAVNFYNRETYRGTDKWDIWQANTSGAKTNRCFFPNL